MASIMAGEQEWLSPNGKMVHEGQTEPTSSSDNQPPQHPVPTMQGAFEESMIETLTEIEEPEMDSRFSKADSVVRRKMLLEQKNYERTVAGRWKQKPGEKFHPLWKLVAQISFGMHLLHHGLAKSDGEVVRILQTHVDEVDGFLERTTSDFDLAQNDISERIQYLRLPLEHSEVFDNMLNDRAFRLAIVEGNEKIEHIVDRTAAAMKDALKDVRKGLEATKELKRYLTRLEKSWKDRSEEHTEVYMAMIGNTEGWSRAFQTLEQNGQRLAVALVQLGGIVAEMQKRAGIASRRNLNINRPNDGQAVSQQISNANSPRYPVSPPLQSPRKALPTAPHFVSDTPKATKSRNEQESSNYTTVNNASYQEPKQTVKMTRKLKKKPSQDIIVARSTSASRSTSNTTSTPPSEPASSTKGLFHKVSFSSRSLSRKISSFMEPDSSSPLPTQDPRLERPSPSRSSRGSSSPRPKTSITQNNTNEQYVKSPGEFADHTLSGSPRIERKPSLKSSARPKVMVASEEGSEGIVNHSHPLLKDIRAKEVRFSSTAPGSPLRPMLRDLPLRHYHSQESLPTVSESGSVAKVVNLPKRSSSVRQSLSPTTRITPRSGSSVYSPDGDSSSVYPSEGQRSRQASSSYQSGGENSRHPSIAYSPEVLSSGQPSSTYLSDGQQSRRPSSAYPDGVVTSGQPSSSYVAENPTQSSSVYSPEDHSSSLHAKSPFNTTLSPPPEQSSATPSPLRIVSKKIPQAPKSAPLTLSHLQGPTLSSTVSSLTSSPVMPRQRALTPPLEQLTSATVSGPEPDINPYDITPAETPHPFNHPPSSPSTTSHANSFHTARSHTPVLTPAAAASATYRSQHLYNEPFSSPAPPAPGGTMVLRRGIDAGKASLDPPKSPWKKVFGNVGRSHRRSKSERVIIVDPDSARLGRSATGGPQGVRAEAGFMGVGKDGVWISRKNFVKT